MPVVQANGLDIHYRIDGAGPETLVLINGVGDDLEGWGFQRGDFAAAGLRVVTFDNRGCGSSSHPPGPYTSQQMAADTKGLVDALGLAPLHLCGVSMGGVIAQEYAIAYPGDLRSVVLANTYAAADPLTYAAFESWALVAEAAGMPVMMRQQAPWVFSTGFYAQQPGKLAGFLAEMDNTTQPASSFAAQIAALHQPRRHGRLGSITTPALVIACAGRHRHQAGPVPPPARGAARIGLAAAARRSRHVPREPGAVERHGAGIHRRPPCAPASRRRQRAALISPRLTQQDADPAGQLTT